MPKCFETRSEHATNYTKKKSALAGNQEQNCVSVSNLITVQQDATYSVYYISVGSSTRFGC